MKHLLKGLVLAGVSILLGHGAAQAHKVTIFAWAEGDRVFTESKFSGGKRVKGGTVTVFDPAGNQLLEGRTDDRGEYSFKIPTADGLTVVLNAGMGHGNSWTLSAAELGGAGGEPDRPMPERFPAEPTAAQQADAGGLSAAEVEAIVARQLDRKLQPLTRMLAAAQEKGPTIGDVVGGLGYIIGLVGLGAYVRYRKESRES
jgi:nickel transport protein